MPTNAERAEILLDTSVAVALIQPDHVSHAEVVHALRDRRRGLAGHAAFETFAVLTRLPPPNRLVAADAHEAIVRNFPFTCQLGAPRAADLLRRLPGLGIAGGSVYDALVGAVAVEHGVPLATRDRRALGTYRALDVDVELIG